MCVSVVKEVGDAVACEAVCRLALPGLPAGAGLRSLENELAFRSRCALHLLSLPLARVWYQFRFGGVDLVIAARPTPERDQQGLFVPIVNVRYVMLHARPPSAEDAGSLAALVRRGQRLGVVRGTEYPAEIQTHLQALRARGLLQEVSDVDKQLRMLRAGRIDALLQTAVSYLRLQEGAATTRFQAMPLKELPATPAGVYLSQRLDAPDRERLREALVEMAQDGYVMKLLEARYGTQVRKFFVPIAGSGKS